jgi:hypothetical protein
LQTTQHGLLSIEVHIENLQILVLRK